MSDQLTELARPFAKHLVKPPAPGRYGNYVEHNSVTEKLLAVLGPFDFEVVEPIRGHAPEIVSKNKDGSVKNKYPARDNAIVGCLARLTVTIDGRETTIQEIGTEDTPAMHNDAENLKNAASDAIKRCAMRIGVGLHLWSDDLFFLHGYLASKNGGSARDEEPEGVDPGDAPQTPPADSASTSAGEGSGVRGSAPDPDPADDPIGQEAVALAKLQPRMKAAGLTNKGLRHAFCEAVTGGRAKATKELTQGDVAGDGPVYEALDKMEEGEWELVDGDDGPALVSKESGEKVSA